MSLMELTSEDALCLNVLLAQDLQAIRIDESAMVIYGLSERGEAKVQLHPNGRPEHYLRCVRELLSSRALGHPGGYPVFLKRWTRMGQARDEQLQRLLLLGEPEAVAAVVCAPGLSDELARRAWWASPTAESARRMLERESVVRGEMGRVLAQSLIEHLPFETDHTLMMETVRLVLQPGLVEEEARQHLWHSGKHKCAYHIGFLEAAPDELPEQIGPRHDWEQHAPILERLSSQGNPYAERLAQVLSGPGQSFLHASEGVVRRLPNHEVVIALLDAVAGYFASIRPAGPGTSMDKILQEAEALCAPQNGPEHPPGPLQERPEALSELLEKAPSLHPEIRAMLGLSRLGEPVVVGILARTTAIGALMRKKLDPVTAPVLQQFAVLRGLRH
jgi:hypothetical protein